MKKKALLLLAGSIRNDSRVRRHARHLTECGYETTVLSFDASEGQESFSTIPWKGFRAAKQAGTRLKTHAGALFYAAKIFSIGWFNRAAARQLKGKRFDLYVANDFDTLPAAAALKHTSSLLIYDSHEIFAEQSPETPGWYKRMVTRWEGRCLSKVDHVVTVNDSIAAELRRRHGLAMKPIVIHNVPESTSFRTGEKIPKSMLYHGVLMRGRGLKSLVEAMELLPECSLTFRGRGPLEPELRDLVKKKALEHRVKFEPLVEPERVVAEASRYEVGVVFLEPDCLNNRLGLPNKIFEYLHAGLAVIVNGLPELAKIAGPHETGVVVERPEAGLIAKAVSSLFADEAKLRRCQDNASRIARESYCFEREKEKWCALIGHDSKEEIGSCAAL